MDPTIVVAIIISIPATIAAWAAFQSSRSTRAEVKTLSVTVDGRLTELLEATKQVAHAEGKAEEKQEQADRISGGGL